MKLSLFWFRRDLRLEDNTALYAAIQSSENVLPLFIFDDNILEELPANDARVSFIYDTLRDINERLRQCSSSIMVLKGNPKEIWKEVLEKYEIDTVFANKDYEPYAIARDKEIEVLLSDSGVEFKLFKDQVVHEEAQVMKQDGTPYTVFTPYKNKWLSQYIQKDLLPPINKKNFYNVVYSFPKISDLGFEASAIKVRPYNLQEIGDYAETRNFPAIDSTSYLGPHLRFGTIGVRQILAQLKSSDIAFTNELIWREFFMQILFHFPQVVTQNFRSKYDGIQWLNNEDDFKKWCEGKTGYPMVDAGMRQLNQTGYMHNRVRMITAGFLCKHLLIDWRWGEAYFAEKLLDYELSSNNGNWQWAAGTGCDAAPYFRIFNPIEQLKKFDSEGKYINKWLPDYGTSAYPLPMIEHKFARERALSKYKSEMKK
ncbi:cryptochrome/photolyase family protein [Marinifilum sp. RC60d5]|uniref:cryptochrome/photolyase family protein n=1 Tax=Marinifilum sp. RC60d5 TaxID=3458414 RepID=UPI0040368B07